MPSYTTGTHAPGWDDSRLPKSTREYLAAGAEVGDRDNALFAAACQFRDAGYSEAEAEAPLIARAVADGLSETLARRKIKSAYSQAPRRPAANPADTSGAKEQNATGGQPSIAAMPSPTPIADGFRVFLETLYDDGERVAIGQGSRDAKGDLVIDYGDVRLRKIWLKGGPPQNLSGVFCRINPMVYRGARNDEVTAYRHTLVEFDYDKNGNPVPKEKQYTVLAQSGLPISTVTDSGNKSLQATVRVDAADKDQYEERVTIVYGYFRQYDFFDDSNKAPNKWCRLPGCERQLFDERGNPTRVARQELLAVKIGPTSWAEYEKTRQPGNDEAELARFTEARRVYYSSLQQPMPQPMAEAAYYGIADEITKIITAQSEACPESILVQFLVGFGNMAGRKPHALQSRSHHLAEYAALIGESGTGCKGVSWDPVSQLLQAIDLDWFDNRVIGGFQSGESLIYEVRDPSTRLGRGGRSITDKGVSDKRLLIMEEEFSRLLVIGNRQGNTLSQVMRDVWDGHRTLRITAKTDPHRATDAHISMIGHITPSELRKLLSDIDSTNGFANRILWFAVNGVKIVEIPPVIDWQKEHRQIVAGLQAIVKNFRSQPVTTLQWTEEGKKAWTTVYRELKSRKISGLIAPIMQRSIPHILRLTGIYTILDNSTGMNKEHLAAAKAVVEYSERSVSWAFGQKTGNKDADRLLWSLERESAGLSRTEIFRLFGNNRSSAEVDMVLTILRENCLADFRTEPPTPGHPKPTERWFAERYLPDS